MNTTLIKIGFALFAIIMLIILCFSSQIMDMIATENFDVLDPKKDTLNFEF